MNETKEMAYERGYNTAKIDAVREYLDNVFANHKSKSKQYIISEAKIIWMLNQLKMSVCPRNIPMSN